MQQPPRSDLHNLAVPQEPEILRRSVATRANFFRPKPFENHFNAEPPYDKAIDYGITSFPDEVSGASQEA